MIISIPDLDPILKYILTGDASGMTEKKKEIYFRACLADDLIREYRSDPVVIDMLMAKFRAMDKDYSRTTAKRDMATARYMFGTKPAQEKEYLRGELIDRGREMLKKAEDAADARGWAAVATTIAKVSGMDRDTPNLPDPEDLRNLVAPEQTFDPRLLDAPEMNPEERRIKLDKILNTKRAEGHNIQDLEEGAGYQVINDGGG